MDLILARTQDVVLMQCNTNYTGSLENFKYINLNVLKTYQKLYPDVILGLSDHTPGHTTVLGAVALGARVIEKHFTNSNDQEGPDHKFSMDPKSWKNMVERTRELEYAMGDGVKRIEENELKSAVVQRRSLRALKDLSPGTIITAADLFPLRPIPEGGIEPYQLEKLIGKKLYKPLKKGEHITQEHLS
jgi:N-acetylneuraminate synthase